MVELGLVSLREAAKKKNQNVNFFQKGGGPQSSHFYFLFFFFKGSVKTMKICFKKGLFHSLMAYLKFRAGMVGAPKVGPARPKIVSAQPSPLAQPNPPGWAGLDFRKPSLDEAK